MKNRNIILMILVAVMTPIAVVMVSGYLIDTFYDESQERLKKILEQCKESKNGVDGDRKSISYSNGTHSINNTTCEWKIIPQGTIPLEIIEENRNEVQQVLDYCNDTPNFRDSSYNYSNETHSINTFTCEWKEHDVYPNTDNLCIPYIDKWEIGEGIRNQTHIFDKDSCTWRIDQDYDNVNDKSCPQFCPKETPLKINVTRGAPSVQLGGGFPNNSNYTLEYLSVNQNDMWCQTEWWIKNISFDEDTLTSLILEQIKEFGADMDIKDRKISIESYDDDMVISIGGNWKDARTQYEILDSLIKNFIGEEKINDSGIVSCY